MAFNKQFESYINHKDTEERKKLSLDSNNIIPTTPPPPKLLPKPELLHRILEQIPNTMPSLTPAPGLQQENIRKFRKSTIDRRNKCKTKNLTTVSISKTAHSIVKQKEPLRIVRKTKVKVIVTYNKKNPKVLKKPTPKLQLKDQVLQENILVKKDEPIRKRRKYVKSLKYSKKKKALLSEVCQSMKNSTETEQTKESEPSEVEENITVINQNDSIEDSNLVILKEPSMDQRWPRIKNSSISYYQVYNIGFADTSKGIVYKCFSNMCKFQTYDQCIFKNHLISFHNDVPTTSETVCALCIEVFSSSSLLDELEHIIKKHLESASKSTNLLENDSIENTADLPLLSEISLNFEVIPKSKAIENNSIEDYMEHPPLAEKYPVLEQETMLKEHDPKYNDTSPDETQTNHTINNLQTSYTKVYLEKRLADDFSRSSKQETNQSENMSNKTNKMLDFSDISSDEDSIFNDSSELKKRSMFDISSDESIKSSNTVSSNNHRINKILNNPEFCVQKILHDGKKDQTFDEKNMKNLKQTKKPNLVKTSLEPTQSSVQTQIQVTVQAPIEIRQPLVMNKLNIRTLQPWIDKRPNFKYEISCKKMLEKNSLFATYKCMGFTCSYFTSSEHLFYGHLKLHQQNHLCDYPDTYLFCSYCSHTFDKIKDLMCHIKEQHQHDKYQCSYCFYRSCEVQSCSVHMDVYHSKQPTKTVLECEIENEPIDIDALFEKLIENRLKYVAPLRCKVCNISIFLLAEYLEHINDHVDSSPVSIQDLIHNEIKTLEMLFSMNHYGFFQCLYCLHGTDIQGDMRAHLANKHASEYSYVCKREADSQLKAESSQSIKSTQLIKLINKKMLIEKFKGDDKELENKDNWCKFNDKFDVMKSAPSTSYIPTTSSSNFVINQNSGIVITNVYSISSETHLSSL